MQILKVITKWKHGINCLEDVMERDGDEPVQSGTLPKRGCSQQKVNGKREGTSNSTEIVIQKWSGGKERDLWPKHQTHFS